MMAGKQTIIKKMKSDHQEKLRVHIFISGVVQGVFFRESTREVAERLSISGWVRNLSDGRVEAVFEGEKGRVEKLLRWVEKGPSQAQVDKVDTKYEKYRGDLQDFQVIH